VSVELHSDTQTLAHLAADSSGSLSATLTLPIGTPEGFHTLHILGTTPTGELVDYYQVISYVVTPKPLPVEPPAPDPEPTSDPTPSPAPVEVPLSEPSTEVKQRLDEPQAERAAISTETAVVSDEVSITEQQVSLEPPDGYVAGDATTLAASTLSKPVTTEAKLDANSDVTAQAGINIVGIIVGFIAAGSLAGVTFVYIRTRR
jgi:hypothetical protein